MMNPLVKHVSDYSEYVIRLKKTFGNCKEMPHHSKIEAFISDNCLYEDWGINESDVKHDILNKIIGNKRVINYKPQKTIGSYKEYLEKLKLTFGMPNEMPEQSAINKFIQDYNLGRAWGINADDVTEDLQGMIDGDYCEMLKEATHPKTSIEPKTITTPNVLNSSIFHYGSKPSIIEVHDKKTKKQSEESKKYETCKPITKPQKIQTANSKRKLTVFLDGDNNITEGQKGIERLSKYTKVKAIFSQAGAKRRFDKKYLGRPNVSSELVESGNQAVDNRIKCEIGNLIANNKNQDIAIVSHDKGFKKYGDRKNKEQNGNSVSVIKSVKEITK